VDFTIAEAKKEPIEDKREDLAFIASNMEDIRMKQQVH
jgi:hypothetical protein